MTSWTMCEVRAREVERRASGVARPRATRWVSWWHVHVPGQPTGLAGQPDAQLWLVVLYQPMASLASRYGERTERVTSCVSESRTGVGRLNLE
jgi:hypothetical protein